MLSHSGASFAISEQCEIEMGTQHVLTKQTKAYNIPSKYEFDPLVMLLILERFGSIKSGNRQLPD